MSRPGDPRRTFAWQRIRNKFVAEARRLGLPCAECGRAIDYDAPAGTRGAPEADHVHPIARGGDPLPPSAGLRIVHKACNSRRGDGTRARMKRVTTSRDWWG